MRQLKGGKQKESSKEKKQRRKEQAELHKQVKTIVLPALCVVFIFIIIYVYMKSRPTSYSMD